MSLLGYYIGNLTFPSWICFSSSGEALAYDLGHTKFALLIRKEGMYPSFREEIV